MVHVDLAVPRDANVIVILQNHRHVMISSIYIKNGSLRAWRGESNKKITLSEGTPFTFEGFLN